MQGRQGSGSRTIAEVYVRPSKEPPPKGTKLYAFMVDKDWYEGQENPPKVIDDPEGLAEKLEEAFANYTSGSEADDEDEA